jgi:hypothetical protein
MSEIGNVFDHHIPTVNRMVAQCKTCPEGLLNRIEQNRYVVYSTYTKNQHRHPSTLSRSLSTYIILA